VRTEPVIDPEGAPNQIASVPTYEIANNIGRRRAQLIQHAPEMLRELEWCQSLFAELGNLEENCDCATRSWYGEGHDSDCPSTWGKEHAARLGELLTKIRP
jgi:hypothetical protein